MRAGALRHRITIEQPTETRDSRGTVTETWSTFATRWAEMEGVDGTETFVDQREHGEVSHKFTLRYLDGVTSKMRVSYDSRVFDIVAPFDPTGRRQELVVLAEEKNPES